MRILDRVVGWVFLAFGMTHCALAFTKPITMDRLWFIGGGLAIIFLAMLNLLRSHYGDLVRPLNWASFVGNCLTLALFIAIALHMEIPLIKAPQVLLGVLIVALLVHFSTKQAFAPKPSGIAKPASGL